MEDSVTDYYPNSVCFENKDELKLSHNWFHGNYDNIFVAIDACQDHVYKGPGSCKPLKVIEEYLTQHSFYVVG